MLVGGYAGKILRVNLAEKTVRFESLSEEKAKKFIGGVGLAAKIIWDETTADTDPFSSENPLIFMVGPLTGTIAPSSSRYIVAAISPLTNIWGQAHAGGTWAYQLKHAGLDGIVIKGKAKNPTYLWINDENCLLYTSDAADE